MVIGLTLARTISPGKVRFQKGGSPWEILLDATTIWPSALKDKTKCAAKAGEDAVEPWDGELELAASICR